jgi:hypothetical protein
VDQFAVRERNFAQVCQHKFKNLNYRILFWILQKNGKWSYYLKKKYDTSLSHYVRCYDYKYSSMFLRLRKYSSISRFRKCFWLRCANDILTLKNQKNPISKFQKIMKINLHIVNDVAYSCAKCITKFFVFAGYKK